jgi:myosin-crossreactive antigen
LIRDGGLRGEQICIFEEKVNYGGSLDAAGGVEAGYIMRGERMFSKRFDCTYDLLSEIPSYDSPDISARDDIFNFTRQGSWRSTTRLIDHAGKPVDVSSMGFDNRDGTVTLPTRARNKSAGMLGSTAATTSRHVCIAVALKARCVVAEVRWRWTLKVL